MSAFLEGIPLQRAQVGWSSWAVQAAQVLSIVSLKIPRRITLLLWKILLKTTRNNLSKLQTKFVALFKSSKKHSLLLSFSLPSTKPGLPKEWRQVCIPSCQNWLIAIYPKPIKSCESLSFGFIYLAVPCSMYSHFCLFPCLLSLTTILLENLSRGKRAFPCQDRTQTHKTGISLSLQACL